jgi:hypothetical protein
MFSACGPLTLLMTSLTVPTVSAQHDTRVDSPRQYEALSHRTSGQFVRHVRQARVTPSYSTRYLAQAGRSKPTPAPVAVKSP